MNRLYTAFKWDLIRQIRYQILTAALVVTALYILVFLNLPWERKDKLLVFLIFNDPAPLGMLFIGSLVLFEKTDRTLEALVVTPLRPWQYLWAKALSLTAIALACSLAMVIAGHGPWFNYGLFSLALVLTSLLFVFLGFVLVAPCRSFNEYVIKMGFSLIPMALPFLNYFEVTDTYWWYIIPSQGTLLLMEASLAGGVAGWEVAYSIIYLALACAVSFRLALRAFGSLEV
jgi:fluoroquinolone transport system permease protein